MLKTRKVIARVTCNGNTQTHRLDLAEGVELIDMLDVLYTIGCQVLPYILEEACYETSRYSRS
jgi:hypothetical protein